MLMNLATTGPDLISSIQIQGAHWSGKSYFFFQGQGKVREFCEMIREILNTKKVREIPNFGPNLLGCAGILSILSDWKSCIFFFAHSALLQINAHSRKWMPKILTVFYFFFTEQLGRYIYMC